MITLSSFKKTIEKYIKPNDKVIVAVSGGVDSICLMHLCQIVLPKKNIIVVHFDHQIRQKSHKDKEFVQTYCEKYKLILEVETAYIPDLCKKEKRGIEEMARMKRYEFLEKVKKKYDAKYIFTAHHQDDNVETILLHLIRGAGIHGLVGMREKTGNVIRPLLSSSKTDMYEYAQVNKLKFRVDRTNFKCNNSRNLLRLKVIPLLLKINPQFSQTLIRNSEQFNDIENFLIKELEKVSHTGLIRESKEKLSSHRRNSDCPFSCFVDILAKNDILCFSQKEFKKLDVVLQREMLKKLYLDFHGTMEALSFDLLEDVRTFVLISKTGKEKRFGNWLQLHNSYGHIDCRDREEQRQILQQKELRIPGKTTFGAMIITTFVTTKRQNTGVDIAFDPVEHTKLFVRTWKKGDVFIPLGMKGTKKLQDFFIDEKVLLQDREKIPIIVDENDTILAICNLRIDDRVKVTEETKKVLHIVFET